MITYEAIPDPKPKRVPKPHITETIRESRGDIILHASTFTTIGTMEIYPTVLGDITAERREEVWRLGTPDLPDEHRIILEAMEDITKERYLKLTGLNDSEIESSVQLCRVGLGSTDTDWMRPDFNDPSIGRGYAVHFSDTELAGRQFALGQFRDVLHIGDKEMGTRTRSTTATIASMTCGEVIEYDHAAFQRAAVVFSRPEPYMMLTAVHDRIS